MKSTQGYIIRSILKIFSVAAIALCLLAIPATYAAAADAGTEWKIKAGDTLTSIAHSIYPGNAPMRDKLTRAIIVANPAIFPDGKAVHIAAGAVITIPDLRTIGSATANPIGAAAETPGSAQQPSSTPSKPKPVTVKSSEGMGAARSVAAVAAVEKPVAIAPTAPQEQTVPGKLDIGGGGGVGLKLSAGAMDLSVIGKLGEEELKRRREGQLLLDSDDPAGSFLALKRQIKHLQTQVEELQLKLDLGKNRASLPATAAAPASAVAPAVTKPAITSASVPFIPAAHTPAPVPTNDTLELIKYALTLYLLPAAEITLALLALFFILRYYRNLRARLAESGELTESENRRLFILAKAKAATADIPEFDKTVAMATATHIEVVEDTDTILQDAQLFVIHGYPDKAIELLEDQIATNHEEVRVWMLLFVILRSQGMKEEFEKFSRRFRTLIHDQSMWENIQDLGRELEPANVLYLNKRNRRLAVEAAAAAVAATAPSNATPAALFPGVAAMTDTPIDFTAAAARSPHDTQDLTVILNPAKK